MEENFWSCLQPIFEHILFSCAQVHRIQRVASFLRLKNNRITMSIELHLNVILAISPVGNGEWHKTSCEWTDYIAVLMLVLETISSYQPFWAEEQYHGRSNYIRDVIFGFSTINNRDERFRYISIHRSWFFEFDFEFHLHCKLHSTVMEMQNWGYGNTFSINRMQTSPRADGDGRKITVAVSTQTAATLREYTVSDISIWPRSFYNSGKRLQIRSCTRGIAISAAAAPQFTLFNV